MENQQNLHLITTQTLQDALSLVWEVFLEFEAPEYEPEGIEEFKSYISKENMTAQLEEKTVILWGAFLNEQLVGVVGITPKRNHINLLFVKKQFHRKGIATALTKKALDYLKKETPPLEKVTVNSSPYALKIYEHLGFTKTDKEQSLNGIRFTPMAYSF